MPSVEMKRVLSRLIDSAVGSKSFQIPIDVPFGGLGATIDGGLQAAAWILQSRRTVCFVYSFVFSVKFVACSVG